MLGEVARAALELLMNPATYQFQSDFARKYIAMGNAEGKAQMLLKLLRIKGFTVSPELAARVESCQDLEQLDLWAERVLAATTLEDIFAAPR